MRRLLFSALLSIAGLPALAGPPRVVADIAPVHSLVATVMAGMGEPDLLVPASMSAHGVALRPSQMRALQSADLVIWVGPALTPWLDRAIAAAGADGRQMALLAVPGTRLLPFRDAALFDHDDDHGDHDGDGGSHGAVDPHAWLDPENAALWLRAIADRLAAADPDNAARYRANADAAAGDLAALASRIDAELAPARETGLIAFHDAFQYFEARFGLHLVGAVTAGDAGGPGPARVAALRDAVRDHGVRCAFTEPQFDPALLDAVAGETGLKTVVLDPLGAGIEPGPGLYAAVLDNMARAIAACGGA